MSGATVRPGGRLWAITSYFNPLGYKRRLANYRTFRHALQVPLATIELSFGGGFALDAGDAEILLQRSHGALLWQKERLLNVLMQSLPAECEYVAWLDCDLLFERADWPERTAAALDRVALVQLFQQRHHLPSRSDLQDASAAGALFSQQSSGRLLDAGSSAADLLKGISPTAPAGGYPSLGMAWAARRSLLLRHGMYDACIVGGGDAALVFAALGRTDLLMDLHQMNERQCASYAAWAAPFHRDVGAAAVSALAGDVFHLWHGATGNRRHGARHEGLRPFSFDPDTDIALSEDGCWRWASDKPEMHRYVADFFMARKEDG